MSSATPAASTSCTVDIMKILDSTDSFNKWKGEQDNALNTIQVNANTNPGTPVSLLRAPTPAEMTRLNDMTVSFDSVLQCMGQQKSQYNSTPIKISAAYDEKIDLEKKIKVAEKGKDIATQRNAYYKPSLRGDKNAVQVQSYREGWFAINRPMSNSFESFVWFIIFVLLIGNFYFFCRNSGIDIIFNINPVGLFYITNNLIKTQFTNLTFILLIVLFILYLRTPAADNIFTFFSSAGETVGQGMWKLFLLILIYGGLSVGIYVFSGNNPLATIIVISVIMYIFSFFGMA